MDYKCPNCENDIEIPDIMQSLRDCICPHCLTTLFIDKYRKCNNCNYFYLDLENNNGCLYCRNPLESKVSTPPLKYTHVKTKEEFLEGIDYINSLDIVSLDTEGNSLDPYENELLLLQLGDVNHVYLFDYRWYKTLKSQLFWRSPEKLFLIHNAKFDLKILKHSIGIEITNIFDTMLAERIITCGYERKNSLKDITEKYLGITIDKEIRNDFPTITLNTFDQKITEELLQYSALDVQLLEPLYRKQIWILQEEGLYKTARLEFEVSKVVADMELQGINVDTDAWNEIVSKNIKGKKIVENKINKLLTHHYPSISFFNDDKLNLNSTKTILDIFKKLNIPLQSTGDSELGSIDHPFTNLLREYRKYEKQLSAFGEAFLGLINKKTKRVHPSFNQIGADTGRFSCTKPNLQQIPSTEEYRKCFSAPPGRKLVICDYSQQELRILASLSGDPKFIKFYEDGVDLHSATASMMFNIPIEMVEKESHRKIAKTINFGLAYGQGAAKLGLTIGVTTTDAEEMIKKYFAQFSYIGEWLENAAKRAQEDGFSKTLLGRKRYYKILDESNSEYKKHLSAIGRRGKNSPIQGSGSDMIKIALVEIHKKLKQKKLDAFIINIIHDEIVVESSTKDAHEALDIVKNCMEESGKLLAPNVPILAEGGVSKYWEH